MVRERVFGANDTVCMPVARNAVAGLAVFMPPPHTDPCASASTHNTLRGPQLPLSGNQGCMDAWDRCTKAGDATCC